MSLAALGHRKRALPSTKSLTRERVRNGCTKKDMETRKEDIYTREENVQTEATEL